MTGAVVLAWTGMVAGGALTGCGGETISVELRRVVPEADPGCGAPGDAVSMQITALGDFPADRVVTIGGSLSPDTRLDLASLPLATRVLRISVFDAQGLRTIGKTAPLSLGDLDDGAVIPVFMTPPGGMCPTGPPLEARTAPIVARAGDQVLIAGGFGATGEPVAEVERYDPATGRFTVLAESLYTAPEDGLIGATATSVSDPGSGADPGAGGSRVVIAGGPSSGYQVYDAATGEFSAQLLLNPGRAHHAAVALDDRRVFLAGGCALPLAADGSCVPGRIHTATTIIDLDEGRARPGPDLLAPRLGGELLVERPGVVLYLGGVLDNGQPAPVAERIVIDGDEPGATFAAAAAGPMVRLASGAVLAGLASSRIAPSQLMFVVPPGSNQPVAAASAPTPRQGAAFARLQNGRVLVVGGEGSGEVLMYQPAEDRFEAVTAATLPVADPGVIALDDGSVLVVGGATAGQAQATASIVRVDLEGPYSPGIDLSFGVEAVGTLPHWVPSSPALARVEPAMDGQLAHAVITVGPPVAAGGQDGAAIPSAWAVVAGPELGRGQIRLRTRSLGAGIAVMLGFRGPQEYTAVILAPGQQARAVRVQPGAIESLACSGETIANEELLDRNDSAAIEVTFDSDLGAAIDGRVVIECGSVGPIPAGLAGVGAVGTVGDAVRIDSVSLSR